jgi:hypothetical protein
LFWASHIITLSSQGEPIKKKRDGERDVCRCKHSERDGEATGEKEKKDKDCSVGDVFFPFRKLRRYSRITSTMFYVLKELHTPTQMQIEIT